MTFRKAWFSNKVVSTEGYSVRILDRATILYEDKKNRIYVSAEMLAPKHTWALYPSDMRVSSARGKKLDNDGLRSLIVERIQAAFEFLGLTLEVS